MCVQMCLNIYVWIILISKPSALRLLSQPTTPKFRTCEPIWYLPGRQRCWLRQKIALHLKCRNVSICAQTSTTDFSLAPYLLEGVDLHRTAVELVGLPCNWPFATPPWWPLPQPRRIPHFPSIQCQKTDHLLFWEVLHQPQRSEGFLLVMGCLLQHPTLLHLQIKQKSGQAKKHKLNWVQTCTIVHTCAHLGEFELENQADALWCTPIVLALPIQQTLKVVLCTTWYGMQICVFL